MDTLTLLFGESYLNDPGPTIYSNPISKLYESCRHIVQWLHPRMALTTFLSYTQRLPVSVPMELRASFSNLNLTSLKPIVNHTHGEAAADRSSCTFFIERFAAEVGLIPYYVQRSRADEKENRLGSRAYYWTKDFQVTGTPIDPPRDALLCLVDVDQYLDMPKFLTEHFKPTIISTFQPSAVSRTSNNYSFTFEKDNTVDYTVTGGAVYRHQVWNYSLDNLKIVTYSFFPFSFVSAVSYLVDRRCSSLDHELILLTPLGKWRNIPALLFRSFIDGAALGRLEVVQPGDFTRLMTKSRDGVMVSTGRVGEYLSVSVPATVDNAVAGLARTSKYDLSLPQVQSLVGGEKERAIPVLGFYRHNQPVKPMQVCPVPFGVRSYQFQPRKFIPDAKVSLHAFMNPLFNGAFCPAKTKANEEQCVQERVLDVQPNELNMTPFLFRAMKEFAKLLIPDPHQLHPTDFDEVLDRQPRPTQRKMFWTSEGVLPRRLISMFMKSEPYGNIKAPRPISTINASDKIEYSRFIYALEAVFKYHPWYAFGMSPQYIASRVTDILHNASFATPTDFSKYDGHGSNLMRSFERIILFRAFNPMYHSKVLEMHRSQFNLDAYGKFGTWYDTGFSRASGSPETSLFNTAFNAFIAFYAQCIMGKGYQQAWLGLGIYGGDDGLSADINPKCYVVAAQQMGQQLTIKVVNKGCDGISFLARTYSPDVWTGEDSTCCDLPRQLSKIHTTVNLPSNVTPREKFLEKIRAYTLTDSNTPIIGDLCKRVFQLHGPIQENEKTAPMRTWLSRFDLQKQYKNTPAEWMHDYASQSMPMFEYQAFKTWLAKSRTLEDLMRGPMFTPPTGVESKYPVVIDGDVYPLDHIVKELSPPILFPHIDVMYSFVERGWAIPDEWRAIMHQAEVAQLNKETKLEHKHIKKQQQVVIPKPTISSTESKINVSDVEFPDFIERSPDIKLWSAARDAGQFLHNSPCINDNNDSTSDTTRTSVRQIDSNLCQEPSTTTSTGTTPTDASGPGRQTQQPGTEGRL